MKKESPLFDSEESARTHIHEGEDREGWAVDKSPLIPEKEIEDDELNRLASEKRFKDKKGTSFIPEN